MTSIYDMQTKEDFKMGMKIHTALSDKSFKAFDEYSKCAQATGFDSIETNILRELWMSLVVRLDTQKQMLSLLKRDLGGGPLGL